MTEGRNYFLMAISTPPPRQAALSCRNIACCAGKLSSLFSVSEFSHVSVPRTTSALHVCIRALGSSSLLYILRKFARIIDSFLFAVDFLADDGLADRLCQAVTGSWFVATPALFCSSVVLFAKCSYLAGTWTILSVLDSYLYMFFTGVKEVEAE